MTKHSAAPETASFSFAPFGFPGVPAIDVMSRVSNAFVNACQLCQTEAARFAAMRFERDAELGQRLLQCRTWPEVLELQQQWASTTAQDYLDQTRRALELTGRISCSTMTDQEQASASTRPSRAA